MNLHICMCLQLVSSQGMWMCQAGRDQGPVIPALSPLHSHHSLAPVLGCLSPVCQHVPAHAAGSTWAASSPAAAPWLPLLLAAETKPPPEWQELTQYGVNMNSWSSMAAARHSWSSQSSFFGKLRPRGAHSPKGAVLEGQPPLCLFKPAMTKHWAMHGRVMLSGNARGSFRLTSSISFCPRRNLKLSQAGEGCFESSISHSSTSSPPPSPPSHPHQHLHGNPVAEE